jgi:hypothetical protein
MRRVLVLCLGATLALPAAALAVSLAQGDGTLYVNNAAGQVNLRPWSGVVLGRMTEGKLELVDPDASCDDIDVWGADVERELRAREAVICRFVSRDRDSVMRFRLVEDVEEIRMINSRGLYVAAVGQGKAFLKGSPRIEQDGTFSINGDRRRGTLPDSGKSYEIKASASLP